MKLPRLPLAFLLLASAFRLVASDAPVPPPEPAKVTAEQPRDPQLPTLWIASDSTAANGGPKNPVVGWGVPFPAYFDASQINVVNRARGGRSSRTFITEGLWDSLVAGLKPGDIVLIQFGHNDAGATNAEPPGSRLPLRARGSIKSLGEETEEIDNVVTKKHEIVHTYGWYMRKMVADTQAKGARPILLGITARDEWPDGHAERINGHWTEWTGQIAKTAGLSFINLTSLTADRYDQMGQAKVKPLFHDTVHTFAEGADLNASLVVAGLKGLKDHPVDKYLSDKGRDVPAAK